MAYKSMLYDADRTVPQDMWYFVTPICHGFMSMMSHGSVVIIATAYGLNDRGVGV
jgi:hypothetical protein